MLGPRVADEGLHYPVSELAARYGASVETETSDPGEAYAGAEEPRQVDVTARAADEEVPPEEERVRVEIHHGQAGVECRGSAGCGRKGRTSPRRPRALTRATSSARANGFTR